jgi:ferredoxin/predicted transcriptional regulator
MDKNDVYTRIAEKFGYPGSASCIDYLKVVFTPEEGELLLEFIEPATCQEVAKRLKIDEKSLQEKLDNFMSRGLLYHGKTQYVFQFGIHVFFNRFPHNQDDKIPPEFWRAWAEFHPEELERIWLPMWTQIALSSKLPMDRVIPHRLALAASPKVRPEDVLWYEDYAEILRHIEASGLEIGIVECPCRKEFQNCDRELMTCLYFGDFATKDLDPKRESRMKIISAEEAIAYSDKAEISGLMHLTTAGNHDFSESFPFVFCNCCDCCCVVLGPTLRSGRFRQLYSPSRYLAVVDTETCKGCQDCLDRCFFNAIEMRKTLTSKKKKAHVLSENCMGCGSCVVGCEHKAITLELVRPPEHIPSQKTQSFPISMEPFGYSEEDLK